MAELLQVLSARSRAHVKRLLTRLADEGKVRISGVTRATRWYDVSASPCGIDNE